MNCIDPVEKPVGCRVSALRIPTPALNQRALPAGVAGIIINYLNTETRRWRTRCAFLEKVINGFHDPRDHADALRCAHGKCFYTRLHGTIGESQGDYGEHHLLPLCDRLRQHSAGGGLSFVGLNNVGGEPPSAVVDAATIAARLNGP